MSTLPFRLEARGVVAQAGGKLRWRDLYSEAELYKAAVRLYTKPLFVWRKALSTEGRSGALCEV